MPKFHDDMIGRIWRQLAANGTLTTGAYLMAVSGCLAMRALHRGKVADVLTVPGFLRTLLFALAAKGGYELLLAAPSVHQRYFHRWLPDKVTAISGSTFNAELKQEQTSYRALSATIFVGLVAAQQYYLPQLLSGTEQVGFIAAGAMATLLNCWVVGRKQHEMLQAVTTVEEASAPKIAKLA
ncbi:MAG: hypothetical protein P1U34_00745 [Coxiellaceae bacterium]|nr:hypothetical protein [Coxiellaceae bacterium]